MNQTKKPDQGGGIAGRTYRAEMVVLATPEPITARRKASSARRPNELTRKTIENAEAGKGVVRCEDSGEMFRKLGL
jgi:hypothetical protein